MLKGHGDPYWLAAGSVTISICSQRLGNGFIRRQLRGTSGKIQYLCLTVRFVLVQSSSSLSFYGFSISIHLIRHNIIVFLMQVSQINWFGGGLTCQVARVAQKIFHQRILHAIFISLVVATDN
mmetsp:Transcript_129713/g.363138  ORF Transcript_129713/g.363138 Transcript_129713/m.363138 type:complete len:123 (-) Transcript_129713:537-905(-)